MCGWASWIASSAASTGSRRRCRISIPACSWTAGSRRPTAWPRRACGPRVCSPGSSADSRTAPTTRSCGVSWFGPQERHVRYPAGHGPPRRASDWVRATPSGVDEDEAVLDWSVMWPQQAGAGPATDPVRPGRRHRRHRLRRAGARTGGRSGRRRARQSSRSRSGRCWACRSTTWTSCSSAPTASARTNPNEDVPFYGAWFVHPGADVPVVLDAKGGDRAQIDWRLLADRARRRGWPLAGPPAGGQPGGRPAC